MEMELLNVVLVWILSDLSLTSSFLSTLSFAEIHLPNENILDACRFFTIL